MANNKYSQTTVLLLFIFLSVILAFSSLSAREKWSVNTTLSYGTGKYIYESPVQNYTLYLGGQYSRDAFSVSVTLPFVLQRDNLDGPLEVGNGASQMDKDHSVTGGASDVYLYSEYNVYPSFYVTGQFKVPTSVDGSLFSTGEFDYGLGFAFRRMFGTFKLFVDAGYLVLGDPSQITYKDPFVYGVGLAKHAQNGKSSVSFYYQEYSQIISGLDPPRQVSVAYYRLFTKILGISFYGSKGFGESSPEYTLSIGMDVALR
jgi:hypothetical protein